LDNINYISRSIRLTIQFWGRILVSPERYIIELSIAILLGTLFGILIVLSPYLPISLEFQRLILIIPFIFLLVVLFNNLERLILVIIAIGVPLNLDVSVIISPYARNIENIANGRTIVALTELRISLIMLVVLTGYILWMVGHRGIMHTSVRYYPATSIPALALILISILSIIQAQDKQLAVFKVAFLVELFLIYFYLANHIRNRSDIQFFLVVFLGGLLAESILMTVQWRTGLSFSMAGISAIIDPQTHRAAGTLGTANSAGVIITAYLIISIAIFWLFQKPLYKFFAVVGFLVGSVALISTGGRAAWGGFLVALLFFFMIIWRRKLVSRKTLTWIFLCLVLIVGVFSPVIYTRLTADDSGSAASRLMMNRLAWNLIQASPSHFFLGVGANNYALLAPAYYTTDVGNLGYIIDSSVHNTYLLVWAEIGLVGLLVFLWFITTPLLLAWKYINSHDHYLTLIALGLACSLIAIYIQMLADPFIARPKMIIIWLLIALVASLENIGPVKGTYLRYAQPIGKVDG
jgi:O-antigen ligase